jgi:hypothetical protein
MFRSEDGKQVVLPTLTVTPTRPTWFTTAQLLLLVLEHSDNSDDIKFARSEIFRMGKILDAYLVEI